MKLKVSYFPPSFPSLPFPASALMPSLHDRINHTATTPTPLSSRRAHPDNTTEKHNDYWSKNGYEVRDGTFFPGFETGWHDADEVLSSGNQIPGDLDDWAKKRAQEKGQPEGTWEWEHGHKQGVKGCQQAGGA